jgi:hypothetical protein
LNLNALGVALSYVNSLKNLNYLILGLDNVEQIDNLILCNLSKKNFFNEFNINSFSKIIDPRKWKR